MIHLPSDEWDGVPISGFDADGFPILDNQYNFEKLELIGFDRGSRGGKGTYPTIIAFKATATSGIVINMGSSEWCSKDGIENATSGTQLKTITENAIRKLLNRTNVFSN